MTDEGVDDQGPAGTPDEDDVTRDLGTAVAQPSLLLPVPPELRPAWNADGPEITDDPPIPAAVDFDSFFLQQWPTLTRRLISRFGCDRHIAEEFAQEGVFEALVRLPELDNPEAYAYTVACHALHKHAKRQQREAEMLRKLAVGLSEVVQRHEASALNILMDEVLTDRQRKIVHWRFVERRKLQEIADQLGVSLRTVNEEIKNARRRLRPHVAPGQEES